MHSHIDGEIIKATEILEKSSISSCSGKEESYMSSNTCLYSSLLARGYIAVNELNFLELLALSDI